MEFFGIVARYIKGRDCNDPTGWLQAEVT